MRNFQVESVLFPDAPQAFYLADGMYYVISRQPTLQIKNDSTVHGLSISSIICQACVMRPSCTSSITFNQGALVLYPDMDFCETQPEPFLASIELTPSLEQVLGHVPSTSGSDLQAYYAGEARQSTLGSLRTELAEMPDVHRMFAETLDKLTEPIAIYYSSISPATSAALESYLPTRTAVFMSTLSITMSPPTFSLSFTLFRRQWRRLFTHPQKFFRGTSGRFIHIVDTNPADYERTDSSVLYLRSDEFRALVVLTRETITKANAQPSNYTSPCAPSLPPRAYPDISSPEYADTST